MMFDIAMEFQINIFCHFHICTFKDQGYVFWKILNQLFNLAFWSDYYSIIEVLQIAQLCLHFPLPIAVQYKVSLYIVNKPMMYGAHYINLLPCFHLISSPKLICSDEVGPSTSFFKAVLLFWLMCLFGTLNYLWTIWIAKPNTYKVYNGYHKSKRWIQLRKR